MQNPYAIQVSNLIKRFGNFTAVDKISFSVKEGEIFGFLGPNGAGKTTTISIITTTQQPTSGTIKVYGKDVLKERDAARQMLGIVFQDPSLDDELTAYENLDFHARLYGVKQNKKEIIDNVLKLVELDQNTNKLVKTFSGGMKRRLEIARGFIHKPKVLFLDEPTIGLDPQTRRKIWDYIRKLNREDGLTIILTTHYLEEADQLCDRISIIDHGRIIKTGTPKELKSSMGGDVIRVETEKKKELKELLSKPFVKSIKETETGLEITVKGDGSKVVPMMTEISAKAGININSVLLKQPSLEDVFINLTGKDIRDQPSEGAELKRYGMRR